MAPSSRNVQRALKREGKSAGCRHQKMLAKHRYQRLAKKNRSLFQELVKKKNVVADMRRIINELSEDADVVHMGIRLVMSNKHNEQLERQLQAMEFVSMEENKRIQILNQQLETLKEQIAISDKDRVIQEQKEQLQASRKQEVELRKKIEDQHEQLKDSWNQLDHKDSIIEFHSQQIQMLERLLPTHKKRSIGRQRKVLRALKAQYIILNKKGRALNQLRALIKAIKQKQEKHEYLSTAIQEPKDQLNIKQGKQGKQVKQGNQGKQVKQGNQEKQVKQGNQEKQEKTPKAQSIQTPKSNMYVVNTKDQIIKKQRKEIEELQEQKVALVDKNRTMINKLRFELSANKRKLSEGNSIIETLQKELDALRTQKCTDPLEDPRVTKMAAELAKLQSEVSSTEVSSRTKCAMASKSPSTDLETFSNNKSASSNDEGPDKQDTSQGTSLHTFDAENEAIYKHSDNVVPTPYSEPLPLFESINTYLSLEKLDTLSVDHQSSPIRNSTATLSSGSIYPASEVSSTFPQEPIDTQGSKAELFSSFHSESTSSILEMPSDPKSSEYHADLDSESQCTSREIHSNIQSEISMKTRSVEFTASSNAEQKDNNSLIITFEEESIARDVEESVANSNPSINQEASTNYGRAVSADNSYDEEPLAVRQASYYRAKYAESKEKVRILQLQMKALEQRLKGVEEDKISSTHKAGYYKAQLISTRHYMKKAQDDERLGRRDVRKLTHDNEELKSRLQCAERRVGSALSKIERKDQTIARLNHDLRNVVGDFLFDCRKIGLRNFRSMIDLLEHANGELTKQYENIVAVLERERQTSDELREQLTTQRPIHLDSEQGSSRNPSQLSLVSRYARTEASSSTPILTNAELHKRLDNALTHIAYLKQHLAEVRQDHTDSMRSIQDLTVTRYAIIHSIVANVIRKANAPDRPPCPCGCESR